VLVALRIIYLFIGIAPKTRKRVARPIGVLDKQVQLSLGLEVLQYS